MAQVPSENQLARWFDTEVKAEFLRQCKKLLRRSSVRESETDISLGEVGKAAMQLAAKNFGPLGDVSRGLLEP